MKISECYLRLGEVGLEIENYSGAVGDFLECQVLQKKHFDELDRRIAEKDEEFAMVRKNQAKALDSMQSALETESKGKAEALRMQKKLQADAADLGLSAPRCEACGGTDEVWVSAEDAAPTYSCEQSHEVVPEFQPRGRAHGTTTCKITDKHDHGIAGWGNPNTQSNY